jgi:hypothetical protein
MRPLARYGAALTLAALAFSAKASATYFHETKRDGMVWASNPALKQGFRISEPVAPTVIDRHDAQAALSAQPASGLYEAQPGLHIPNGKCEGDPAAIRKCELAWETTNLAKAKTFASRSGTTLTLMPSAGANLVLTDWEKCSAEGECDGERYTLLGPLKRSTTIAVEIDYEHDSPSLLLFDAKTGNVVGVHYGSEPTFLNGAETLLVSVEDVNDASSLIVTRLEPGGPGIDVQCLGARTESSSFGITFKRWVSDTAFDFVLVKTGKTMAARLEKTPEGPWTIQAKELLKAEGFECRQRGGATNGAPAASPKAP